MIIGKNVMVNDDGTIMGAIDSSKIVESTGKCNGGCNKSNYYSIKPATAKEATIVVLSIATSST